MAAAYREAVGAPLAFIEADVQWSITPAIDSILVGAERAFRAAGVPFGIIADGGPATSDKVWVAKAIARLERYEAAGGRPDIVGVESWEDHPDHLVPETDGASLTAIAKAYIDARRPRPYLPPAPAAR